MSDWLWVFLAGAGFFIALNAIGWSMWMAVEKFMYRNSCADCGLINDHTFNCQMNWV
jgi:hypothetical protein